MTRIEIFFGEMGSGKSYHARLQSEWSNIGFLEGDELVPHEMIQLVKKFRPVTREMIIELVDRLIVEIKKLADFEPRGLAVSQALYFDGDRNRIDAELREAGHEVVWYWVRPSFTKNMRQLLTRSKGFRWVLYWLANKPYFEQPTHRHVEI